MDDEKLINEILQDIETEEAEKENSDSSENSQEKDLKKQEKENKKKEKQKKYPDRTAFFIGFIVLIFAVIGIVLTVVNAVDYFRGDDETKSEFAEYNSYLAPVAAVDIDTFDDITAADKEQLISSAIWLILSYDSTPDTYPYSNGYMLIPEKDVEESYVSLFGPETAQKFTHMTVQGYNSIFEYDRTNGVYKIPVTTISPVYTPKVTGVEQSGTSLIITVDYLPAESWANDGEGNIVAPEPDKVMKITLRELQGSYYISAIQTVSSTVPEVVIGDELKTEEAVSHTVMQDSTTIIPEKHTLSGRV